MKDSPPAGGSEKDIEKQNRNSAASTRGWPKGKDIHLENFKMKVKVSDLESTETREKKLILRKVRKNPDQYLNLVFQTFFFLTNPAPIRSPAAARKKPNPGVSP